MRYEDDIPTKKETESESSRFQKQNEHSRRKKSISCQKSKRKKTVISLGRNFVAFSSIQIYLSREDSNLFR